MSPSYVESARMGTELVKPGLSWSRSRSAVFNACLRQYFYKHHFSWNGWNREAPERRRIAYRLSKMTSFPFLAGIAAHEAIRRTLCAIRDGDASPPSPVDIARDVIRRVKDGAVGRGWLQRPKAYPPLEEYYYDGAPSLEDRERWWKVAKSSVEAFVASPLFSWIRRSDPADWLAVDEPANYDNPEVFEIDGCRVWCRPDFAMRWRDKCLIFDWKTGTPKDDDRRQLHAYALHARACWGFDTRNIRTVAVHLGDFGVVRRAFKVTPEALDAVESDIRTELDAMRRAETAGDLEESWPLADDAAACTRCFFRELCPAVLAVPAHRRVEVRQRFTGEPI